MVVDLPIDTQGQRLLPIDNGLSTRVDANDAESLMTDDRVVARPVARPVRAAVTQAFDAGEGCGLEETDLRMAMRLSQSSLPPRC